MKIIKLNELKKIELNILKNIVTICDENNVNYYIISGTLLGAVRHSGFIPWDDDIDIAMFRDDYDKFIKIWGNKKIDGLILQNKLIDERTVLSFSKIRLEGSQIIEESNQKSNINKGIFVDVFPLDKLAKEYSFFDDFKYLIFRFMTSLSLYKTGYRFENRKVIGSIARMFSFVSYKKINEISEKIMKSNTNKETDYYCNYASNYGFRKFRMNKNIYGKGVKIKFEDSYFNAPEKYDVFLKKIFDDYMELPPIEERGTRHKIIGNILIEDELYEKWCK